MKKRIFSIILIVILLGLYGTTLVVACFTDKSTSGLFMACLFASVVVPILLYAYQLIYKVLASHNKNDIEEK